MNTMQVGGDGSGEPSYAAKAQRISIAIGVIVRLDQGCNANDRDVLVGCDVFIGVSKGNLLTAGDIQTMAPDAIVLAMANPVPEIMPEEALAGGAAVVGTGRSDFPNQVNNLLAFPGIFRGALNAKAAKINDAMKIAAAHELARQVHEPTAERILPDPLDRSVAPRIAQAVEQASNATD